MRSLTVWACTCGTRYKAICEMAPNTKIECTIVCEKCQRAMTLEGKLIDCIEEKANGLATWSNAARSRNLQIPKADADA